MPRGDGTGPAGQGGQGGGRGKGRGQGGTPGPGGNCVCPNCGNKEPHQRGTPCNQMKCPECGTVMMREG